MLTAASRRCLMTVTAVGMQQSDCILTLLDIYVRSVCFNFHSELSFVMRYHTVILLKVLRIVKKKMKKERGTIMDTS